MVEEPTRRRRRRRRGRRGGGGSGGVGDGGGPAVAEPEVGHRPKPAEWRWRTFPVFFAFAVGGLVMGLAASSALALPYFFVILFVVAFGAAHIMTRIIVTRRRRQR